MGLDERLSALADRRGDETSIDVEAALVATRRAAARRAAWRRGALAVAAAVALVATTVVGVRALRDDGQTVTAGPTPAPAQQPPPDVDRSTPHLWLSAAAVPPSGADLAVIIVDPTASGDTWGVRAAAERWDGERWTAFDRAAVCLDFWPCSGEIGGDGATPNIGLNGGSGMGPLAWLRTGPLDPGWYRLTQTSNEGTVAAGQFEVRGDAPAQPPDGHAEGAHLSVTPPLRLATMSSTLGVVRPVEEGSTTLAEGWQDGTVRVERWDGGRWSPSASPGGSLVAMEDPADGPGWSIDLGHQPAGAYRLLVDGPTETVEGRFWVEDLEGG